MIQKIVGMIGQVWRKRVPVLCGAGLAVLYIVSQPENMRSDATFSAMLFPVYGILPLALASLGLALYLAGKGNRMLFRWILFLLVYAIYIAFGFNLLGSALLGLQFFWEISTQLLSDFFNHVENVFYWFIMFLGGFALFAASFMSARFACLSEDAVRCPQPENISQVKKGLVAWGIVLAVCAACVALAVNFIVIG